MFIIFIKISINIILNKNIYLYIAKTALQFISVILFQIRDIFLIPEIQQ